MTLTKEHQQILDAFVDTDLETEGYNNQGFYMCSEQRIRYVLVTLELSPENRFYNCVEFIYADPVHSTDAYTKVNNPELLQELIDMDYDALEQYVCRNNFEWLGDDFDHMNEYLSFVSDMQDKWQFIQGDICNDDEYMEIIKQPWILDKERGYKSDNKYEIAYKILSEYVNPTINKHVKKRLEAIGVSN
jgi:hypothetical protein|tara:strand:+ start:958 stop:1524 length:567 start_codon:yes stop_codon:yes gene_type:complete